ncbi:MAG: hypothetical protein KAH77_10725, partial [Thiomargarita sp.]|nr:hypothetical protein [Thiomargarita sp.]
MDDKLRSVFKNITKNQCLQTISSPIFWIYDDETEKKCLIVEQEKMTLNRKTFKVINHNKQAIRFLAVDKCIFSDNDNVKRCDCIIYNKEYFCFIELKKVQKRKNRAKNTARTQLLSTIE